MAPPRSLLLWIMVLCTTMPHVCAIERFFQHRFLFESANGEPSNYTYVRDRSTITSVANLVRWNTYTIIPEFGMEAGGRVELEVWNISYSSLIKNNSGGPRSFASTITQSKNGAKRVPVVFTLYNNEQWRVYSVLQLREMPLRSPTILCHYPSTLRHTVMQLQPNEKQHVVFDVEKPSSYTLQVQVCGEGSAVVSGYARMVNMGYDNRLSEHLPVEQLGLIPLYKAMIVAYSTFTLLWILECFLRRRTVPKISYAFQVALHVKNIDVTLKKISYAFQVALHVKNIDVTLKLWYYRELSLTGQENEMFDTAQDIAESATSAALLGVLLLAYPSFFPTAAACWSLTRDQLTRREHRLIIVVFGVYFSIALIKALCDSEDDLCKAYLLTEYVIKSVMMLGVIVALNFTISQLRLAIIESRWNSYVTPLTYMKLNQFQSFRGIFLMYLLIPTALLIANLLVVSPPGSWRYEWVNELLTECSTLFIYANVGFILRPLDPYIYSRVRKPAIVPLRQTPMMH
ncbi:TPA: hypothetical protein N0F65_003024 [Lagenidium giganteum]|uniref:Intimal thickness related receptor IRP domain-containing protein n=1 Tax=Lagenidium giganteum TaxID=4803 RepID=A0AAV2YWB1_9STRA|nr:TPA: hypothetical protein N0F65_003024 [Lagenidium giganteum]